MEILNLLLLKKKQAKTFTLISVALTLLSLCIELTPMLTKLIISRGAYDDLIDATEYELNNVVRDSKLRTDTQIRISSELYIKSMKINSTPKRILAMIGIGAVLVLTLYLTGVPQKSIGALTGGILFFVWMWFGWQLVVIGIRIE